MTGLEIALFVLGAAFIIISCFIVDNDEKKAAAAYSAEPDEEMLEEMKLRLRQAAEAETEQIIYDTEDKLNVLTNDKIMAVSEFSNTVLEKLDNNHQEVVFLYEMLKQKEEELKNVAGELDRVRLDTEKFVKDSDTTAGEAKEALAVVEEEARKSLTELLRFIQSGAMKEAAEGIVPTASAAAQSEEKAAAKPVARKTAAAKTAQTRTQAAEAKKPAVKKTAKTQAASLAQESVNNTGKNDVETGTKRAEVLELYKRKKSVMEISKLMGMGQGEVKLIIDLYGKN